MQAQPAGRKYKRRVTTTCAPCYTRKQKVRIRHGRAPNTNNMQTQFDPDSSCLADSAIVSTLVLNAPSVGGPRSASIARPRRIQHLRHVVYFHFRHWVKQPQVRFQSFYNVRGIVNILIFNPIIWLLIRSKAARQHSAPPVLVLGSRLAILKIVSPIQWHC